MMEKKQMLFTPGKLFSTVLIVTMLLTILACLTATSNILWGVPFQKGDYIENEKGSFLVEEIDLTPEPGEFISKVELEKFYLRQALIMNILSEDKILYKSNEKAQTVSRQEKTLLDLSSMFWIQIIVGLGAIVISGWIWSLRAKTWPSILFFISGLSTLCFTYSSAIYTTRELALPVFLFKFLVMLNTVGASLFGMSIISLFLIYPVRFKKSKKIILGQAVIFGPWTFFSVLGLLPAWMGVNLITLVEMILIIILVAFQIYLTRNKPRERASLIWLGLSIIIGAGGFIGLNALPLVFDSEVSVSQGHAFLFFLFFYMGLAAGIGRYRLFDVGSWAYKFLFYMLGITLIIILDSIFLSLMNMKKLQALSFAFIVAGFCYFPFRERLRILIKKERKLKSHDLIREALFVALTKSNKERIERWEDLLKKIFNPLTIEREEKNIEDVILKEDGVILSIPRIGIIPSYNLKYANSGKSLYTKESVNMVRELLQLIKQVDKSRDAYDMGVKEERERIAQDLHDDVGARLLTGLHAPAGSDLRPVIQEVINDIRTIVKGIIGGNHSFVSLMNDLRVESKERAELFNIEIEWPLQRPQEDIQINYTLYKTINSVIREIITNALKHSSASLIRLNYLINDNEINYSVEDNGRGFLESEEYVGYGLKTMKKRMKAIGGEIEIIKLDSGVRFNLRMPL